LRNTLPLCKSRNESRKGTFKGFVNELLALNGIEIVFRQNRGNDATIILEDTTLTKLA
jgi:hypothetical protein